MGGKVLDEATSVPWRGGRRIKDMFAMMFPHLESNILRWGSNGHYSIYISCKKGPSLVFWYEGKDNWRLETVESYKKGIGRNDTDGDESFV